MQRRFLAIRCFIYVVILAVLPAVIFDATECSAAGKKYTVTAKHVSITLSSADDLIGFNSAIKFPDRNSISAVFDTGKHVTAEQELVWKVDLLFEKVQAILDMRKSMGRVKIRVYSDENELHAAYEKIYGGKCTVRGWYVYEFNTVFLNVQDVHEGMLAHELGHAIIDHYLTVRPPRATAEILAKYVDMHLHEEVREY